VTELERAVARLRDQAAVTASDAAAARVLAGGAGRDVADMRTELRAHTQTLNALRETQLEQGQRLDTLDRRMDTLDGRVTEGFAKVNAGMEQIVELLRRAERA
jgi:hypothetical protein